MKRVVLALLIGSAAASAVWVFGAGAAVPQTVSIVTPPAWPLSPWTAQTDDRRSGQGTLLFDGAPVSGARLRIGGYELPAPTDAQGHFGFRVDDTLVGRNPITVADATHATRRGAPLTGAEQSALLAATGAVTVAYPLADLQASRNRKGDPVLTGRVFEPAVSLPPVSLYTYRLTGLVLGADGKPVAGAHVSTRTQDRDYWTVSSPSDSTGAFSSFFTASSESPENPVAMTVRVSVGNRVYNLLPDEFVYFARLQSARLVVHLPPFGYPVVIPVAHSYPGAIYQGVVVGGTVGSAVVRPLAATWPDRSGKFTLTFPRRLAGKTIALWEGSLDLFSAFKAIPGGSIDLQDWPTALGPTVPRDLGRVRLP